MVVADGRELGEGDPARPGSETRAISGDHQIQTRVLKGLAPAVNYRRWLVELAIPYLGENPIEIGSGLGDYALDWAPHFPRFTATDGDPARLKLLKERLAAVPTIDVRPMLLPETEKADYSGLVCYNVLEHIEDDVAALQAMARLVSPGSAVVLIVPAFQFAMSPLDVATGHFRRYTKRTLSEALHKAGLRPERIRYVNALGLICYYLATSVFGLMRTEGPMVKLFDTLVLPVTKAAETVVPPPWGQSVFVVARVPESAE